MRPSSPPYSAVLPRPRSTFWESYNGYVEIAVSRYVVEADRARPKSASRSSTGCRTASTGKLPDNRPLIASPTALFNRLSEPRTVTKGDDPVGKRREAGPQGHPLPDRGDHPLLAGRRVAAENVQLIAPESAFRAATRAGILRQSTQAELTPRTCQLFVRGLCRIRLPGHRRWHPVRRRRTSSHPAR